jgi:hypothetical protein
MKKYEYTYKILNIDLHSSSVTIKYTPTIETLTAYTFNVPYRIIGDNEEEIVLIDIIKNSAPHIRWENQELLVADFDNLLYKTELITTDA